MSDPLKSADRIPYESLTDSVSVSNWSLPSIDHQGRVVKAGGKKQEKTDESIETVSRAKKPKPLTAEELQLIADEAKKEGYNEGYQEGSKIGLDDGLKKGTKLGQDQAYAETKKKLEDEYNRLKSISQNLMQPLGEQEHALENIVIDMSIQLAKTLLQNELKQSPEYLFDIVKHAIAALPAGAKNVLVYLNERDAELFNQVFPEATRNWSIVVDNSLETGGCKIETAESLVDYSVTTRLQQYLLEITEKGENAEFPMEEVPNYITTSEDVDVLSEPPLVEEKPDSPVIDDIPGGSDSDDK
ncbi:flagellar assembly protein FliH [Teredinibacter sp. KSP-S5-2]|uniref:flagellar assembly protein FliH n=1 Tax=Teredinibacter sp. KSP-S5-2 TaxID=3034506 RepID=UPI0029341F4A|nr:flagellar assembly protein FliH [Teredinibacter sp. KSP-S5-2]WNO07920.1 flagellar assembly protein FliH [Teredinibacter sp. KSP-S5-2]